MKAGYKFANLCGTVYRQGNLIFTPDGNSVLSPVGNRVSVFDLVNNKSRTLYFETRKNVAAIALSPDGNILLAVDDDGHALLANFRRGAVLHHHNFHKSVKAVRFSPDGKYIAVTHDAHVQVWRTPNHLAREFAPFALHRTYTGHHGEVLSVEWAGDSRCFLTTSRDMTARLFTLDPLEGFRPKTFAGHRDAVLGGFFAADGKHIYTVSRDGAVFVWKAKPSEDGDGGTDEENESISSSSESSEPPNTIAQTRWGVHKRHYLKLPSTKVTSAAFHARSNLLVIGLSTGVFGLYELPSFSNVHTLSVAHERVSSVAVSPSGEWLAIGARALGQLLVWEWQSESFVLKQQGHAAEMNSLAYAPDGRHVATAGADGKVKLWDTASGFCFVTFAEHSAGVSQVEFAGRAGAGGVLFSASLDGTVRAWDLARYRNFRTFTSPAPAQFASLAVDPSGEVVAAGAADAFEVYMWSVQTGRLLDVLAGHEGPVCALAFSPTGNLLASGSWDGTVRVWSVFGRSGAVEPFVLGSDVLAVAFRPDGRELAVATLDGQLVFFDVGLGKQTGVIDGRKDIVGGRRVGERTSAANGASGKAFTSIAYTADGRCVLAGGNSKYVVLYDVQEGVALKKFTISENLALDGTEEFLDSRKLNDAGMPVDLVDDAGEDSDDERHRRADDSLPGAARGDLSKRRYRPTARTTCVRFAPTGRAWAAATPEGLLLYTLDGDADAFDPLALDIDLTPQAVLGAIAAGEHLTALVGALRMNERPLIKRAYAAVPRKDVRLIARQLPRAYVQQVLALAAAQLDAGPHLEFDLAWVREVLGAHGRWLREARSGESVSVLRAVQKALTDAERSVAKLCDENASMLAYLTDQAKVRADAEMDVES